MTKEPIGQRTPKIRRDKNKVDRHALLGWFLVGLGMLGHCALHIAIYNRINATGLRRSILKLLKYCFLATWVFIPVAMLTSEGDFFRSLAAGSWRWEAIPLSLGVYFSLTLLTLLGLGPDWLRSRPPLHAEMLAIKPQTKRHDLRRHADPPMAHSLKCRLLHRLPLNQIFLLDVEEKAIPVENLPSQLEELRIAHLSDVHLTGHVSPAFYRYALERAMEWKPDLIALTGDIVDRESCLPWLATSFAAASAPLGCYFVLGNHDLRVRDPRRVRTELESLGWTDLGGRVLPRAVAGVPIEIIGNEAPWFPPPELPKRGGSHRPSGPMCDPFRLLLSHSPDQIRWARQRGVGLMLAGHTHGGQGRLPWIGPVLSPSHYGSRYASGTFFLQPTTMHVTRGLSGVHLLRIHCPPELALLRLVRAASPGGPSSVARDD